MRILIVDERETAAAMAASLEYCGHSTFIVEGDEAAARAASQFRPDLILLDADRPGINARTVAWSLRTVARHAKIVSLSRQTPDEQIALVSGLDGYYQKPARLGMILESLQPADRVS